MTRLEYLQEFVMQVLIDDIEDLEWSYEVANEEDPLKTDEEFDKGVESMRLAVELIRERVYGDDN